MANTHWEDRTSEEIVSSHISGLQDAVKNIEQSLDMDTEAVSEESLTLLADASGSYRIAEAVGKRNWLNDPAPVIEQYIVDTWTTISAGFTIDYAGGAIIFTEDKVGEQFRASFTRVKNTSGFQAHLSKEASSSQLGHAQVDDTTIIASSGVITALPVQAIGGWDGAVLDGLMLDGNEVCLFDDAEIKNIEDKGAITVSSNDADKEKIRDNSTSTVWGATSSTNAFCVWNLGAGNAKAVNTFRVYVQSGSAAPNTFKFQASTNGTDWIDLVSSSTPNIFQWNEFSFTNIEAYQYYKYLILTNHGAASLINIPEVEMWYVTTVTNTGTFYIDHTPPNLIDYGNIYFNKVIPAVPGTQTVTLAVKDTSDNVLIADVQDNASLSSIDPMTYPTIRIHGTLTRADAGDESPSVGAPLISYIGTAS